MCKYLFFNYIYVFISNLIKFEFWKEIYVFIIYIFLEWINDLNKLITE